MPATVPGSAPSLRSAGSCSAAKAASLPHCCLSAEQSVNILIFGQRRFSLVHLDWKLDSLTPNCQLEKLPEGFCHIREQQNTAATGMARAKPCSAPALHSSLLGRGVINALFLSQLNPCLLYPCSELSHQTLPRAATAGWKISHHCWVENLLLSDTTRWLEKSNFQSSPGMLNKILGNLVSK